MGDRTYVSLLVPLELAEATREALAAACEAADNETEEGDHLYLNFAEVNYGELDGLENLRVTGIPYSVHWDAGDSYGAGDKHLRFTEQGEVILIEVYDEDRGINPSALQTVLKAEDVRAALTELLDRHRRKTVPLPWENQVEYGKRYLARQLLEGTPTQ